MPQSSVFEQAGLVTFDGEMVVRLPVLDQVAGELTLRQQRIGADVFAFDVDGLKPRDGHLIGLLGAFGIAV